MGHGIGCAIDSAGFVWTWGSYNDEGQLGLNDTVQHDLPAPVLALKSRKITQAKCGGNSFICLGEV